MRRCADVRRAGCVMAVMALVAAAASPAVAQPATGGAAAAPVKSLADLLPPAARADFDGARLLYGDGDFAGAGVKFRRAWESSHDYRLLWNLAACEKALRHYGRALTLLRRYEKDGGPSLSKADRDDLGALMRAVAGFVTTVRVTGGEPGAAVFVDDESVGALPLAAPVLVDLGKHRVRVSKEGFADFTTEVDAGGAQEVPVAVAMKRSVTAAAPAAQPPSSGVPEQRSPPPGQPERSTALPWALVGGGGAVALGGVVVALVGKGKADDAQGTDESGFNGGKTLNTVGWVVGGVGAVAAATGVVLLVTDGPAAPKTGVGAGPWVTAGGAGVRIGGAW